jgi:hypothetical protein
LKPPATAASSFSTEPGRAPPEFKLKHFLLVDDG